MFLDFLNEYTWVLIVKWLNLSRFLYWKWFLMNLDVWSVWIDQIVELNCSDVIDVKLGLFNNFHDIITHGNIQLFLFMLRMVY